MSTVRDYFFKIQKAKFTSLIEKGPGFMKLKTGASHLNRVPTTQEGLGKNKAQPLPTV